MIIRVFPRKTAQTPDDKYVFFSDPPSFGYDDVYESASEVHISCTFTYDRDKAERLYHSWNCTSLPVKIGGVAYGDVTTDFIPGRYVKHGVTFTSTGCNNKCWFCNVWKLVGGIRELEIKDGHIIQDDNFLSCSENHIRKVFQMLKRQKEKARFVGGLEAKLLKEWHVELFADLKPQSMYFAYDTADDYEPLVEAGKLLKKAGITLKTRIPQAFVLMGYHNDTWEKAEKRCIQCLEAGFIPFAMLYKDDKGEENKVWKPFQRVWARQAIIYTKYKDYYKEDT